MSYLKSVYNVTIDYCIFNFIWKLLLDYQSNFNIIIALLNKYYFKLPYTVKNARLLLKPFIILNIFRLPKLQMKNLMQSIHVILKKINKDVGFFVKL